MLAFQTLPVSDLYSIKIYTHSEEGDKCAIRSRTL